MTEPGARAQERRRLLDSYLATAERWAAFQRVPDTANAAFEENHRLYKLLRTEPEGRDGIARITEHPNTGVRLLAATHSLGWAPADACPVLEAIAAGTGLHAVTAKYTLRSYRSGKLDLEW